MTHTHRRCLRRGSEYESCFESYQVRESLGDPPLTLLQAKKLNRSSSRALDSAFPRNPSLPLQHLRRFCKREMLPDSVRDRLDANQSYATMAQTIFVLIGPPLPDIETLRTLLEPFLPPARVSSPVTSHHSREAVSNVGSPESAPEINLITTTIPIYPPANATQAETWSNSLWPVVYNPAAARATIAPPPQTLTRAQRSIEPRAGYYLSLARHVGEEAKQSGRGRGVGAVIVDPEIEAEIDKKAWEEGYDSRERWMKAVIAVAGDSRFARAEGGWPSQADLHPGVAPNPANAIYDSDLESGPDLHALMRVIELVAHRRREGPDHELSMADRACQPVASDPQLSEQLSAFEAYFLYEAGDYVFNDYSISASSSPASSYSMSPRKRKHEDRNPESGFASLDGTIDFALAGIEQPSSAASTAPLPAPPPSTTALSDLTISQPSGGLDQTPPLTPRIRTRAQGGYLCTDLDVYLSHEPCLCCSMGILLSRFRAVIFPRAGRMQSGGLASEPVLAPSPVHREAEAGHEGEKQERPYYGLHWRKELNWRALGFEFIEDEPSSMEEEVVFHA